MLGATPTRWYMRIVVRGSFMASRSVGFSSRPPARQLLHHVVPGVEASLELRAEIIEGVVGGDLGAAKRQQIGARRLGPGAHGAGRLESRLGPDPADSGTLAAARVAEEARPVPRLGLDVFRATLGLGPRVGLRQHCPPVVRAPVAA